MRNDLIMAVFNCKVDDFNILDDAGADMYETIDRMKEEGMEISLNGIMGEIFREGIFRLGETVKAFRADLENKEQQGKMTEASYEQLKKLRDFNINPQQDFGYYLNCLDTHLYCDSSKRKVYEEMFEQELQELVDYTGFDIQW